MIFYLIQHIQNSILAARGPPPGSGQEQLPQCQGLPPSPALQTPFGANDPVSAAVCELALSAVTVLQSRAAG